MLLPVLRSCSAPLPLVEATRPLVPLTPGAPWLPLLVTGAALAARPGMEPCVGFAGFPGAAAGGAAAGFHAVLLAGAAALPQASGASKRSTASDTQSTEGVGSVFHGRLGAPLWPP